MCVCVGVFEDFWSLARSRLTRREVKKSVFRINRCGGGGQWRSLSRQESVSH